MRNYGAAQGECKAYVEDTSIPAVIGSGLNQFATNRNNEIANSWELGSFSHCDFMQTNLLQAQKQQNDLQIQSEKLKQSQMKLISDIDKDRADMVLRYQQAKDDSEKEQAKIAIDLYDHQLNVLRTAIAHMEE